MVIAMYHGQFTKFHGEHVACHSDCPVRQYSISLVQGEENQIVRLKITRMDMGDDKIEGDCGREENLFIYLYGTDVEVYP